MSIESILAVSPDLTQAGLAVGMGLLIFERVFTVIKPLLSRNGRNGHGETGKVLATLVEKVDGQRRDLQRLTNDLGAYLTKVDILRDQVTENTVALKMSKRDCPALSGQLKVAQPEG